MEKEIRRVVLHPPGIPPDHVVTRVKRGGQKDGGISHCVFHRHFCAEYCLVLVVKDFNIYNLAQNKRPVKRRIHQIHFKPEVITGEVEISVRVYKYFLLKVRLAVVLKLNTGRVYSLLAICIPRHQEWAWYINDY